MPGASNPTETFQTGETGMRFNILDLLFPRENKFYSLFSEHAGRLAQAARRLRELVAALDASGKGGRRELLRIAASDVKELEKQADKLEARINEAIEESFITPLDRDDIHLIASVVDNAIDAIKMLTNLMDIYALVRLPPRTADFADIIVECAQALANAFAAMEKKASVNPEVKIISEAERRADYLFSISIGDLFKDADDPIDLIKAKELYEGLEEIVNRIDIAGKLLRRIMIKQG
jgi:uncharacterized protein Yka (UPF0111/DUF47 family)